MCAAQLVCFRILESQLLEASSGGFFKSEARMVQVLHGAIESDPTLTLASPLGAIAAAAHREQESAKASSSPEDEAKLRALKEAMVPYVFDQALNSAEMTVTIKVPPSTTAKHVNVKCTRDKLIVAVAGHALQPHVINGRFLHPVDQEACDWHFDGSGDARVLVIDLFKRSSGLDWSRGMLIFGGSDDP